MAEPPRQRTLVRPKLEADGTRKGMVDPVRLRAAAAHGVVRQLFILSEFIMLRIEVGLCPCHFGIGVQISDGPLIEVPRASGVTFQRTAIRWGQSQMASWLIAGPQELDETVRCFIPGHLKISGASDRIELPTRGFSAVDCNSRKHGR
jgi:hypothetical protein